MIFDQENMFIDNSLETTNVIANVGGGDAHDPLFLVVFANTALTAADAVTVKLQTCDAVGFGSNVVTLGEYTVATSKKGMLLATKVPYGMKAYARVAVTGSPSAGALTAGLTATVPNWN